MIQEPRYPFFKKPPPEDAVFVGHWGKYDVYAFDKGNIYITISDKPPKTDKHWCNHAYVAGAINEYGGNDKSERKSSVYRSFAEFCDLHYKLSH